ncbi:hypothetical protein ACHAXM_007254 [Skeletonema potamos]
MLETGGRKIHLTGGWQSDLFNIKRSTRKSMMQRLSDGLCVQGQKSSLSVTWLLTSIRLQQRCHDALSLRAVGS